MDEDQSAEDQSAEETSSPRSPSRLTRLSRFSSYWAGMTSLLVLSGGMNCPCCGQPSCPIGIVNASVFGALCACGMNWFTHWKPKPSHCAEPEEPEEPDEWDERAKSAKQISKEGL